MLKALIFLCLTKITFAASASDLSANWDKYEAAVMSSQNESEKLTAKAWDAYQKKVSMLWGKPEQPAAKQHVEFSENKHIRITINYETGEVLAEALKEPSKEPEKSSQLLKKEMVAALSVLIKDPSNLNAEISADEIDTLKKDKTEYLNQQSQSIAATRTVVGEDGKSRNLLSFRFKLVSNHIQKRAKAVYPVVKKWAEKYKLDPAFILAIIRQESAFNPRAKSWVPAYGLMQIVPKYAGKDVVKELFGQQYLPSENVLYDAEQNIMMGTTYLKILRDNYFSGMADNLKQQFIITCGYNWGPSRLQKAINNGRLKLENTPDKVFNNLLYIVPNETKDYLQKVTRFQHEFKKLIAEGGFDQ